MKYKKFILLIIILALLFNLIACSKLKEEETELHLEYIITTYSNGKEIESIEVYSDMEINANKNSITIYNSQGKALFYTTLQYKIESILK